MVLTALLSFLQRFSPEGSIYADLPDPQGMRISSSNHSPTIIGTTTRLDLFVADCRHAAMLELTVLWNNLTSIKNCLVMLFHSQ